MKLQLANLTDWISRCGNRMEALTDTYYRNSRFDDTKWKKLRIGLVVK